MAIRLEDLKPQQSLQGVEPNVIVRVIAIIWRGVDSVSLIYSTPTVPIKERFLSRSDESSISIATAECPWAFDGEGEAFKLAVEAKRIDLAFLFDPMMAVHTSNVEPLPHQITAVYESMLPRQPLRFVLADDPGAGKTIMAGLYISELIMRADAHRILIVAPGSLVDQWRDELYDKFGLEFQVFNSSHTDNSYSGNPFDEKGLWIMRLDQAARNEEVQDKLCNCDWDLVVFDESHKLSAHYYGDKVERTKRFLLAEKIGAKTRHLLLMTATPHNGKEADFQLYLSLLDSDRFYGRFRDGVHKVDVSDLMRRMIKEDLVKFDGTPLFPERKAYTVNYTFSDPEAQLYTAVTEYVKLEMGRAEQLSDNRRKGNVGFALTTLQRRLASSPEAIFQSLRRRKERLESKLREEKIAARGQGLIHITIPASLAVPEDEDDLNADEQENIEEQLVDLATAAQTIHELELEIETLCRLEAQALSVVHSGLDRKWDELSRLLQHNAEMRDAAGLQRKLIIFSEHRDTLNYLQVKISNLLGRPESVVTIHGGTNRDARRKTQASFRSDPDIRVLIATDAAGEGVNLQNANLMVNYDLPWNPNRLEQRFGRIHRIGQTEVCHLWNLVAKETREGDVYARLLDKLQIANAALNGRVFDVLGEVFEDRSLKDLLVEAIRYGEQPEVQGRLTTVIDSCLDTVHLQKLLDRNALSQESMNPERLYAVKAEMEKAEARRLQPYFVRAFFEKAFNQLSGELHRKELNRFEIRHVPSTIRERDRLLTGRNRREQEPVLKKYERVCFEKKAIRPTDRPGLTPAVLIHPGHPIMLSVIDLTLEKHANLLRQGTVLVDPSDPGDQPWLLYLLTHKVKDSQDLTLSERIQFIRVESDGTASFAGWAPHLDYEALSADDRPRISSILNAPWVRTNQEQVAIAMAASDIVPKHFAEVRDRRVKHIDKTLAAVHERLTKEINFWTDRWMKLREDRLAGKDVRGKDEQAHRTLMDLQNRLDARRKTLQNERHIVNGTPVVLGGALIIPSGLLQRSRGEEPADLADKLFAVDPAARARIERIAMQAVAKAETDRGCTVVDVSAEKCGWDITSYPPAVNGTVSQPRHIEVKGRVHGATTITVTRNEMLYAFNQGEKFVLAIVMVHEDDSVTGPHYIRRPFSTEPGWGVASINFVINDLLVLAGREIS